MKPALHEMTPDDLVRLAEREQGLFVHRFKHSHDSLRRRTKKLMKAGRIQLTERAVDGFTYKASKP